MHDWSDSEAIQILKSLRQAIGKTPNVVVALVEMVLPDHSEIYPLPFPYAMDITMNLQFGAKERTRAEWAKLLVAAGFKAPSFTATRGFSYFITSSVDTKIQGDASLKLGNTLTKAKGFNLDLQEGKAALVSIFFSFCLGVKFPGHFL